MDSSNTYTEETERKLNYPYFINFISIILVLLNTAFTVMLFHPVTAIITLIMAGVYFWIMHKTKVEYLSGTVVRGRVVFVAIGGAFLVFFANFFLCTVAAM